MADPRPEPESQIPRAYETSDWDQFSGLFQDDEPGFAHVGEMLCPLCSQINPQNHKYCGFCGVPLHTPLLASEPSRPSEFSPPSLDELQFLRNSDASHKGRERDRRGWLYLVIGIAVLIVGFIAFERYYEPDAEPRAAAVPTQPVSEPPTAVPATPPQGQPVAIEPQTAAPPVTAGPAPTTAQKVVPAARISPAASPTRDGAQELAQAVRYLSPTNPARNPATAAEWLWKSVGKGNVEAEVTLSDLYLRGEGVPRSCEQARLLLRTAAGKGAADAATKLRTLQCR